MRIEQAGEYYIVSEHLIAIHIRNRSQIEGFAPFNGLIPLIIETKSLYCFSHIESIKYFITLFLIIKEIHVHCRNV